MLDPIAKSDAFIAEFAPDYAKSYPRSKETVTIFKSGLGRMEDGSVYPYLILEDSAGQHYRVHIPEVLYRPEHSHLEVLGELIGGLGLSPSSAKDRLKDIVFWEES